MFTQSLCARQVQQELGSHSGCYWQQQMSTGVYYLLRNLREKNWACFNSVVVYYPRHKISSNLAFYWSENKFSMPNGRKWKKKQVTVHILKINISICISMLKVYLMKNLNSSAYTYINFQIISILKSLIKEYCNAAVPL